ncbi:hypothetical protein HY024_05230 [Candidatus Curtissbacteria bacterium]|nr:hypothetical protein [Candidatus Curtissbacteria bacterium]
MLFTKFGISEEKINKSKLLLFFVLIASAIIFRLWQSTGCTAYLVKQFKLSDVTLSVESERIYEQNPNSIEAKIFNNKLTTAPHLLAEVFTSYFEPRYLLNLIGPIGTITVTIGVWTIIKKRSKKGLFHLAAISLVILYLTFQNQKENHLIALISLLSLSAWSKSFFVENKWNITLLIALFIISIWYFMITWHLPQICNEIIFK